MEQAPKGIEVGKPAAAVRVRSSIMFLAIGVGVLVVAAIGYGLTRKPPTSLEGQGSSVDLKAAPASENGRLVSSLKPKPTSSLVDPKLLVPPGGSATPALTPTGIVSAQVPQQIAAPAPSMQPPAPVIPPKSGEQVAREQAYEAEQQAILSSPVVSNWGSPGIAAVAARPSAPNAGAAAVTQGEQTDADHVDSFIAAGKEVSKRTYLPSARVPPASSYEIKAGWMMPAILESELNSDLPGEFRALIATNVYDTKTGRYLLIPQGARLIGTYSAEVQYGQGAISAQFSRLVYPDASSQVLDGMEGQDAAGRSGFRDRVDRHYTRLLVSGLMTSLFSAAAAVSVNRGNNSALQYPTATQTASQAVGQQMSQLGIEVTRKNLNVPPTIKVRPGYRFNVFVAKDMIFEQPYR